MGMNGTPRAERVHIALFGNRNAGKSSLINALTGQELAIVSDQKGTTTDPVYKSMELLPLGPVVMIDTPGLDDTGDLGQMRIKKALDVLNGTDIAMLVLDCKALIDGLSNIESAEQIMDAVKKEEQLFRKQIFQEKAEKNNHSKNIPLVVVLNKIDLLSKKLQEKIASCCKDHFMAVSSREKKNIQELKELLGKQIPEETMAYPIVSDLVSPGDMVVLVIPIDSAAPKGRLILPQQQTIRELLEAGALITCTRETELPVALSSLKMPSAMVITDSQAFGKVSKDVPDDILLTSFSILFARHKGELLPLVQGVKKVKSLQDGDKILISEGCTHHRQCDDIGTVKIPCWLRNFTKKELVFEFSSGMEFREDLNDYALVVHCGGCMLNARQMRYRIGCALEKQVPIVNYGILIAYLHGILERSLEPFPDIRGIL